MSILIITIISLPSILLGKWIFKKWINHLTLYSLIMGALTFFYELKLLPYPDVIPLAWFFIFSSFLSFLLGVLTIISARRLNVAHQTDNGKSIDKLSIFQDGGKALRYSILFFSFIGLFVAIQRWVVLINMFGSIPAVMVNAAIVHKLNVNREIKEFLPILPHFVYVAVFLVGIYSAYKKKFSFLTFFPFLDIIIKELTYFGRGEILFAFLEFIFSFFLFRHLLNNDSNKRFRFSKKNAIIASTILIALIVLSASLIRVSRGAYENYMGASSELKSLKSNFIISPSIYLYLSSDVGVFSKYLESAGENTSFGGNTFYVFYDLVARLEKEESPKFFQKGYYVPMWTNTGTYIRELHADFGGAGVFLGSFLLGFICTWLWFKFLKEKNLIVLAILVYLYVVIGFSFQMMVTRLGQWFFSLFLIVLYLPVLERIADRKTIYNSVIDK
jgi:oligosaccharide repeat unit polymerase